MTEDNRPPRVLLFDDLPRHNASFAVELKESDIDVVGVASTPAEMYELVRSVEFDVAVLDMLVGPGDELVGLAIGIWLRIHMPHVGVLMFTSYVSPFPVLRLLNAGPMGVGYLLKNRVRKTEEIISAISRVRRRQNAIDPGIREELITARKQEALGAQLTEADLATLECVVEGMTNGQISEELNISVKAVEARLTSIFDKLGLTDADGARHPNRRVATVLMWVNGLERFRLARDVPPIDWPPLPGRPPA